MKTALHTLKSILIFFLIFLGTAVSQKCFAQGDIYPVSELSFTGGSSVCYNTIAPDLVYSFNTVNCGTNPFSAIDITVTWFSNTVNTTSGGTQVWQEISTTATTSYNYTPPTNTIGTLYYYVEVSWGTGFITCATAGTLTSDETQQVIVNAFQPVSVSIGANATTICAGTSVTFTATPTNGGTAPSYQWKVNGVNAGTNSPTFTTSTLTNGNIVTVVMTSNITPCETGNPATSNAITMTVNALQPVSVSISIIGNPTNTICAGTNVTFTAASVNGGPTRTYQWYKNGLPVGLNQSTYTTATLLNADAVSVVLTSSIAPCPSGNPATSNTITMTVNPILPVSVSIAASAISICAGTSVTFTATPTNGGTVPSYQWKVNGINAGTNSPVFTTATLANGNIVTVVMTSNITPCATGNPATSNPITMTVNAFQPVSVSISASSTTICSGSSITFTATPVNGGTTPSYQWYLNGNPVGSNQATYTTTTLVNGDAVNVVMTSNFTPCASGNPATSNTIIITVNANQPVSVSINSSDADNTICAGTSVTFTATPVNGGTTPSYQWYLNGSPVGSNQPTYTTTTLVNGDAVNVVMTSNIAPCASGNPATSNTITTLVNANNPVSVSINSDDADNIICIGTSVTFTATPVNGGPTPSYQWYLNGNPVGSNLPTYTTTTLANADVVTVILTSNIIQCSSGNPATSNAITMTVNALQPVSVNIAASATTICTGTSVTFTATPVNGGVGPSYQWKVNGINAGTNSSIFTTSTLANADVVTVELTSNITPCATGNPATSNAITMNVSSLQPVSVSIAASATTICAGTSVTFTATPTNGGATPSYQWKVNGINAGSNSPVFTTSTLANGNIVTVVMTSSLASCTTGNPATSNSITMTVNALPSTVNVNPSSATICQGSIQSLVATNANTSSVASGTINLAIPDNNAAGVTNTLTVSGIPAGATINSIDVNFNIAHTNAGDLIINLKAPNNNVLNFVNRRGGTGDNFTNTVVSSNGVTLFSAGATPFTGTFAADAANAVGATGNISNVAVFSSLYNVPNGSWIISVRDAAAGTSGTLSNWTITINWSYPITWLPITDLYTDAGATIPYSNGQILSTVYAKPAAAGIFTYTAMATIGSGCTSSGSAVLTVNPTPSVNITPSTQTVCSGTAISQLNITNPNNVAGTTFTWVRDNTVNLTGIASSGSGSTIPGTLTNATTVQQTTIFTITATAGSCSSTTTANVKVNPTPLVNNISNVSYCNGAIGAAINFGSNVAGATFAWSSTADVGFGISGTGNIPSFTVTNPSVTATISVTATASGCPGPIKTFTITVFPTPSVTVSADYCIVPGKVRLTANPLPAGSYTYLWSNSATTQVIDVDIAGSYTVTVTNSNGCKATNSISIATELAVNGNFEAGNVGFTTGYNYNAAANGLQPEGNYAVNNNPNFNHTNFWGIDHTTGTGKMMIINGLVGPTAWQETVTVVPNTTYYFSAWALSMNNIPPFAQLQFSVNGSTIGVSAVLVAGVNNNSNSNWQRFYGTWSSGALSTATCSIVDLQGALGGNDFALDDISISTLSPAAFSVIPSILGGGVSVCTGSTLNLSANLVGGSSPFTFSWTGPAGFTSNLQNPSIPNVTAANSGTYTVTSTDFYGCVVSSSRVISVGVPAAPSPVTATPATICLGSGSNLNATTTSGTQTDFTGFYAPANWAMTNNPALTGGSINISGAPTSISITSGNNGTIGNTDYTITNGIIAGNFTFNWSYKSDDLASNELPQYSINGAAAVNLTGFNAAGANIQSGTVTIAVPANQTFALRMRTVNGTLGSATTTFSNFSGPVAGNILWYTVPSGGSSIGNTASGVNFPVTPASSGVISYYAETTTSIGCASSTRTQVNITVNQPSAAATSLNASVNPICSGSSTTLTQTGGTLGTGASWKWYSDNTYTTLVGTGVGATASLSVSPVATTTYYLRAEGTTSPCTANVSGPAAGITITVRQPSIAATILSASPNPICKGSSTTLTQSGGSLGTGASWKWYSDASYTTLIGTGVGATASLSVSPLVTTTYYLRAEGATAPCAANAAGPVAGVTVTVNQPSVAATSLSASPNPICNGSSTTLTQTGGTLGTGASWKWYSDASYTTLVGTGVGATASLSVSPVVTTTYYLRAEGATAPCAANAAGPVSGVTVTVNQPSVPATTLNASINPTCKGSSTTLTQTGGTLGTGASWKWYSDASYTTLVGTGVGATASLSVSPVVTTTYYLRAEGATAPCAANAAGPVAGVTVTVNQPSVAATSLSASPNPICNGSSTTLTQIGGTLGTGASWKWYSDASYTTLVGTGVGATASLSVSPVVTTTYYLRAEGATAPCAANAAGPVSGVTVTVNQPSVSATTLNASVNPICNGSSTTLTQTGGTLGTGASWKWYSDASYTTLVGTGVGATASLTVSPLVTTTYYLRAEGTTSPCAANATGPAAGITVIVDQKSGNPTSATASPLTICTGSSTTLTLAGGGGGANETIVWYIGSCGGTVAGTGNNLIVSPAVTTTYYGRYENGAPCNFVSSCTQVTVNVTATGTWLGVNNNWNSPVNWCGGVPTSSTDVIIPFMGSGIYPKIFAQDGMAHDITMAAGTSLIVNNRTLMLSGTITNNGGVFDLTDGELELNGTGASQNISGSLFFGNTIEDLRISNSNGVNITGVNDTLKLSGVLKFGVSNATLNTNGNLTLLSSAAGTASVGDMTNNGANSGNDIIGNVTVERYIPNHSKAWQFLSVPTKGQTVNAAWQEGNTPLSNSNHPGYGTIITSNIPGAVALGFDVYTPAGPTMKTYDSASNGWIGIASPGIQIANQKGYMLFVRGDRSVTAFNQAPTSTILRTTGKLYTSGVEAPPVTNLNAGTFESIGNPYASAIDFNNVTKTGAVQDLFYVWDPKLTSSSFSAYGLGAFQTIIGPGPTYTVVPGGGSYAGNTSKIESGQAFIVHATFADGSVSFTESCKVDGSNLVTRPSNAQVKQLRNNLYVFTAGNPVLLDGTMAQFDVDYSNTIDEMDALKIANSSENLSILRDGKKLVVERRAEIQNTDTIFYNLGLLRVQQYQFEFIAANLDHSGLTAFLEDNYLQTTTPVSLQDTTRIMFNVVNIPGSYAADRFRLVFQRLVPTPVTITSITANRNTDKTITINWKVENETNMQLYTIERSEDGRDFSGIITADPSAGNGGSASYSRNDISPLAKDNFYRIKALSIGGQVQYSDIVKVAPVKSAEGITIYPNPVTGKTMHLQFVDQLAGKYNIVLVYSNGMQQPLSGIEVNSGQSNHSVMLPQLLASGIYRLQITGPDGNSILKTVQIANE